MPKDTSSVVKSLLSSTLYNLAWSSTKFGVMKEYNIDINFQINDSFEVISLWKKAVKIYLSKRQAKNLRKKIEQNKNWESTKIDERLKETIEHYIWEEVNYKIPEIENYYWIFTNRTQKVENKHSVDEFLEDGYYAISFGMFDIDNNILYYYEQDR